MRRSWPFALAVVAVGAVAGVAIAGRPQPSDDFVLDSTVTVAASASTTSTSESPTSTSESATATSESATPTAGTTSTTETPATTIAPTTVPGTDAPTTTSAQTPTTITGPLPRDQVRLVIANGDGRFRLASVTADRIRPLGYVIELGDAVQPVDATVIYYRPGFDDEAVFAAVDIGVPDALIFPFPFKPSQPITNSDDNGDVIIVLGPDAPR
jgi:hypothetical protein